VVPDDLDDPLAGRQIRVWAHTRRRSEYVEIMDWARNPAQSPDVLLGGGIASLLPQSVEVRGPTRCGISRFHTRWNSTACHEGVPGSH
jgi:alkaline phosphatase